MLDAERSDREWRKSTRSLAGSENCVEVSAEDHTIFVRDSKNPQEAELAIPAISWQAFIAGIKAGEFDPTPDR